MFDLMIFVIYSLFSFTYAKNALHMFQQNRYELYRYSKWLFSRNNLHLGIWLIYCLLTVLAGILLPGPSRIVCPLLTVVYAIYNLYKENKRVYIKDLVLTARVKRQIAVFVPLIGLLVFLCLKISLPFTGIVCIFMPYLLIYLMAVITEPVEDLIKKRYENEARAILGGMDRLVKIGITGSYGKTSTKNIVYDIISDHRLTLMTPASYNTPMGITRTIREMLKPIHEVFICEMGADKVGDIAYLMDFVRPRYGMVTSIGPQHLNTFHSLDNIVREKMQEIEMLPQDGVGFLNIDNDLIAAYEVRNSCKIVTVGIENKEADYLAENVRYSKDGTSFAVRIGRKKYRFNTVLLGKHNVTNILLGIALAIELGVPVDDIVSSVAEIRPIEHRLQVKKINGFTFIDDAFNSNPVGSKMALDVLSMMPGRRVIVTPGMIDLGEKQDEINEGFGAYMYGKTDYVILVGEKQSEAILRGLKRSGFDEDSIRVFGNIRQAFEFVYREFSAKDTILLENDLPDAFNV